MLRCTMMLLVDLVCLGMVRLLVQGRRVVAGGGVAAKELGLLLLLAR